jgi:hypothetical protein
MTPQVAWQLWPAGGGPPRTVTVTQPDWVDAHCFRQIALRTDYRSDRPIPPPAEQPYPKDGLVIAPDRPLEPIESIPVRAPEAAALQAAVTPAFDRAERELADRARHPIKREVREQIAASLEAVYAFGTAPRMFYVEAVRGYRVPKSGGEDCSVAFGTGWFLEDATDAVRKLDMAVDLVPCNRYGATYMLPLGVVRADGRAFWLAQYSGWDHERYMVVELKKDKIEAVVAKWGGGC